MKLKKYKKKTPLTYIARELVIIICALMMAFLVINYFYKQFNDTIMPIAEAKTRKYITEIINNSTDNIKFDKIIVIFAPYLSSIYPPIGEVKLKAKCINGIKQYEYEKFNFLS